MQDSCVAHHRPPLGGPPWRCSGLASLASEILSWHTALPCSPRAPTEGAARGHGTDAGVGSTHLALPLHSSFWDVTGWGVLTPALKGTLPSDPATHTSVVTAVITALAGGGAQEHGSPVGISAPRIWAGSMG